MAKRGENIYLRKDGRYEGRYVIGKKANGKTAFGYVYGKKYTEVKKKLDIFKGEQAKSGSSSIIIYQDGRIDSWLEKWLESYVKNEVKASTYAIYRGQMEKHILPVVGKKKLRSINKNMMQELYRTIQANGASESTAQNVCRRFRHALSIAQEEGFLKTLPPLPFHKTPSRKKESRCLTELEQKQLEQILDSSHPKDFAILFSLYTGIRVGECCALQWNDINFTEHEVTISHTIQRVRVYNQPTKTTLLCTETKTQHSIRKIPLTHSLEKALLLFKKNKNNSETDFIFGNGSKFLEPRTLQSHITQLAKQLHLEKVHFHTLRHTFATRCIEHHMDVKTLSELLGHSSVKISLDWYCHSTKKQKKSMIQRLEKRIA